MHLLHFEILNCEIRLVKVFHLASQQHLLRHDLPVLLHYVEACLCQILFQNEVQNILVRLRQHIGKCLSRRVLLLLLPLFVLSTPFGLPTFIV